MPLDYSYQPMGSYSAYRDPIPQRLLDLFKEIQNIRMMGTGDRYGSISDFSRAGDTGMKDLEDMYYRQSYDRQQQMNQTSLEDIAQQLLSIGELEKFKENEAKRLGTWEEQRQGEIRKLHESIPAPAPLGSIEEATGMLGQGTFKGAGDKAPKPLTYARGRGASSRLGTLGIDPIKKPDTLGNLQKEIAGIFGAKDNVNIEKTVAPERSDLVRFEGGGIQGALEKDIEQIKQAADNTNTAIDYAFSNTTAIKPLDTIALLKKIQGLYKNNVNLPAVQAAIKKMKTDYDKGLIRKAEDYYIQTSVGGAAPTTATKQPVTREEIQGFINNGATVPEIRQALKEEGMDDDSIEAMLEGFR